MPWNHNASPGEPGASRGKVIVSAEQVSKKVAPRIVRAALVPAVLQKHPEASQDQADESPNGNY
jgi:hypothetical protein